MIKALCSRNVDILTAKEADLIQTPDQDHLDYATSLNRTVFTFSTRAFAKLHTVYLASDRQHAGIIVSDQLETGVISE